ncbi:MAG TPA: TonB-dependent receptor [Phenylobacterium sp.]|jgi:outer membrane cobalamin receptor|nr:TonB-dependent receptor [Phenylobacterium sp.]
MGARGVCDSLRLAPWRPGQWLAALSVIGVAAPGFARAQDGARVSDLVVTASHFPQTVGSPTADTTVLSPVDAPPGANLGELLSILSDIEVQQPGGAAGVGSIFVRGAKPNFTLVMIDGVPLNDQTNSRGGSADVSALTLLGVDRVEVVRGALSSIYGSGAIQGAVNLILPSGAPEPAVALAVDAAIDRGASAAVLARGPLAAGLGGSLGADWDDAGHAVEGSSRVNWAVSGKIGPLDGSDAFGLVVHLAQSDARAFPDESGGPRLAVLRAIERTRAEQALIGAHWRFPIAPDWTLELNGAGTASRFDDTSPGAAPGPGQPAGLPSGVSRDRYEFGRIQAVLRWSAGRGWRVLAGVESQQEEGRDESNLKFFGQPFPGRYSLSRTTPAAFTEADFERGALSADASLRVDDPEGLGDHLTGRVGAAFEVIRGLRIHAAWGRSFKAPSFYALGNGFVGNSALRPETADTTELGAAWTDVGGVTLDVSLFRTQFRELIDFVPGPPPRLENRSSVLSQGAQATIVVPIVEKGTLSVSTSYVDTRDQTTHGRLADLPPWRATAVLDWRFSTRVQGRLDARFVADRLDISVPTGTVTLPPYATVGARLIFDLPHGAGVEASLENALNRRFEEAIGFPSPGLVGRIAVRRNF